MHDPEDFEVFQPILDAIEAGQRHGDGGLDRAVFSRAIEMAGEAVKLGSHREVSEIQAVLHVATRLEFVVDVGRIVRIGTRVVLEAFEQDEGKLNPAWAAVFLYAASLLLTRIDEQLREVQRQLKEAEEEAKTVPLAPSPGGGGH